MSDVLGDDVVGDAWGRFSAADQRADGVVIFMGWRDGGLGVSRRGRGLGVNRRYDGFGVNRRDGGLGGGRGCGGRERGVFGRDTWCSCFGRRVSRAVTDGDGAKAASVAEAGAGVLLGSFSPSRKSRWAGRGGGLGVSILKVAPNKGAGWRPC